MIVRSMPARSLHPDKLRNVSKAVAKKKSARKPVPVKKKRLPREPESNLIEKIAFQLQSAAMNRFSERASGRR